MTDWTKINKVVIFKGNDENGNRYLNQFLADYKRIFNPTEINAGCERCLDNYYEKLLKHLSMSKSNEKSPFALKKMYEGIPLEFGSQIFVNNKNITKEYAEKLVKNHPRGKDLFDALPEGFGDDTTEDPLKGKNRGELDAIAVGLGLVPEDYANKDEITKTIKEKQEEISNTDANPE